MIDKKNMRILFNIDKQGKINDLIVAEFDEDRMDEFNSAEKLYNRYSYDVGNCLSDWEKMSLHQITLDLCFFYGFANRETKIKYLTEMMNVKEFRKEINPTQHLPED
jgi:hypothetical protein